MLRAYIQSIDFPSDTEAHVVGVVTDDVRKAEIDLRVSSMEQLRSGLRNVLQRVDAVDKELRALRPNDVIDLDGPVPDPDGPAKLAFVTLFMQLQSALRKVTSGVIASDAPELVQLLDDTKKAYRADFVGLG